MRLAKTSVILSACITLISAAHRHYPKAAKTSTSVSYYCKRHCMSHATSRTRSGEEDDNEGGIVYAQATSVIPIKKLRLSSAAVLTSTILITMDSPLLSPVAAANAGQSHSKFDNVMFLVLSGCSVVVVGALTAAILIWRSALTQHGKEFDPKGNTNETGSADQRHVTLETVQVHDILSTLSFQDQGDFFEEWKHAVSGEFVQEKSVPSVYGRDGDTPAPSPKQENENEPPHIARPDSPVKPQRALSRATTFDLSQDQFTPLQNQHFSLVPRSMVLADPVRRRGIDEIALWEEQQKRKQRQRES
ncbi:hypothetical protein EC973_000648 [Apophysomyces ossiformis]|uniref:Transmembrane protein n=1 Tax=Apophysomyces ossiformis TaxID=679940 RepID=A0A8H7BV19_9FUNG|nr:hypothetical protein EC973_000648 [Apophysomyces ossiformis]